MRAPRPWCRRGHRSSPLERSGRARRYNRWDEHSATTGLVAPVTIDVAGFSHPGHVRQANEDLAWWEPSLGALVVADGMGGHNAGEVAAQLAIEAVAAFLEQSVRGAEITWPYGINAAWSDSANRLFTAVTLANRRVREAAERRSDWSGMGTTVVAALLDRDRLTFVGVGDSRLYRVRAGVLDQLTRDDSFIASLIAKNPALSPAEFATHPMRHVLTSVVGGAECLDVTPEETPLRAGDRILLSTDGLHGVVEADRILDIVRAGATPADTVHTLVELALARGGPDNVTAVVAFVE